MDIQSSSHLVRVLVLHNNPTKKRYKKNKAQTNRTYDDEYRKLPSFKKRVTVLKRNYNKKANMLSRLMAAEVEISVLVDGASAPLPRGWRT